jgi:hypothetical protein
VLATLLLASESKNTLDPCQLLTKQEAEKILKVQMKPGRLNKSGAVFGTLSCNYLSVDRFEKSASVTLSVGTTTFMKANDAVFESAKEKYEKEKNAYLEALKRQNKTDTFLPVEGLGDDAYWGSVSLYILQGDAYINIKVSATAGMSAKSSQELKKMVKERNLAVSKAFAKIVLPKLKQQ